MPQRPTLATVVAILGMLYGGTLVACTPISLLVLLAPSGPMSELMPDLPSWYRTSSVISSGLNIVLGLLLLVGSIGLWQLRPWSRKALIGWAVASLLMSVVGTPLSLAYARQTQEALGGVPASVGAISTVVGVVLGCGVALVLYGGMIFAMTRPVIIAACEGDEVGLPAETPVW